MKVCVPLTVLIAVPLLGCAHGQRPSSEPAAAAPTVPDTSVLRFVAELLTPAGDRQLFVDPRPLDGGAPGAFVGPRDLADVPVAVVAARVRALERMGRDTISMFERQARCGHGPGGLPPRDAGEEWARISRLPPTACLLVSLPRRGPAEGKDAYSDVDHELDPGRPELWTVRIYFVQRDMVRLADVVLRVPPEGDWEVVEQVDLSLFVSQRRSRWPDRKEGGRGG